MVGTAPGRGCKSAGKLLASLMIFPDIKEFWSAIKRAVRAATYGIPLRAGPQTEFARLEICEGCCLNVEGQCLACTCFIKLKTKFATEKCPLGKWPAVSMLENR